MKETITKEFRKKLMAEGITRQAIYNWQTGKAKPSPLSLKVIERILLEDDITKERLETPE